MKDPEILSLPEYAEIIEKINKYYTYNQDYHNNFNDWDRSMATKESIFWEEQEAFEISLLSAGEDSIPVIHKPIERKQKLISKIQSLKGRNFLKLSLNRYLSVKGMYKRSSDAAEKLLVEIDKLN
ncbi:MAG: hypothetical protein AAF696_19055 [Bacteroidota bacterium]